MPELPAPLPAGQRTVGQLVAETIRLYGDRFWHALPLGLPIAALDELELGRGTAARVGLFLLLAPAIAFAFARAAALAGGTRPSRHTLARATAAGAAVLVPAALLLSWFALLAVAYLALVGLVVPVVVLEERTGLREAFRRAGALGRADYVHAVGSLAALVVVFFLSRLMLVALLNGQADNAIRVAVLLADLVLAPLLLLGAALLYFDQAARIGLVRPDRRGRRSPAVGDPAGPEPTGAPDTRIEP